jgi:translation initiation factor 2B subunit (eIF-2B alpha/beta/delta family)
MEDYQKKLLEIESQSAELLAALDSLETESAAYARSENKLTSTSEQLAQLIDSTKKSIIETQNLIRVSRELSGPEIINYLNVFSGHLEAIGSNTEAINASLVNIQSEVETKLQKLQSDLDNQSAKASRSMMIITGIAVVILILQIVLLAKG